MADLIPEWLERGVWAIHSGSNTVFQPQKCVRGVNGGSASLIDLDGIRYPAHECDCLSLELIGRKGSRLVTGGSDLVSVSCVEGGLKVGRWLIQIPSDPGLAAAHNLAWMFHGVVVTEGEFNA